MLGSPLEPGDVEFLDMCMVRGGMIEEGCCALDPLTWSVSIPWMEH